MGTNFACIIPPLSNIYALAKRLVRLVPSGAVTRSLQYI